MIFEIEKRRSRKNGVLSLTRCYYLRYRFGDMAVDRWKSLGVTDKQVAERKAQEFRQEKEREEAGIIEPKVIRDAAKTLLSDHLSDYVSDLVKRNRAGRDGRGGRQLRMRVSSLLQECGWKVASHISPDSFIGWRSGQKNSARTLNLYLQAASAFLNWMERMGRIKFNPLKHVSKIDERGKASRVRRAFTDAELRLLVSGSDWRGIVYFTAARTGLRQDELKSLIWDDLRLEDPVPFVRVRVACAKNKKEETIPLVPEICEVLRAHRPANVSGKDFVFPRGVPRACRLRTDLESNGIPYQDEFGRYGDFHALRYTWATFLQRHGVAQRVAMKLMRHSDINLTTKVYTDESQLPIYDAILTLPRLMDHTQIRAQILGAEGQNGSLPVAKCEEIALSQVPQNKAFSPSLTHPVACGQMERAKRFELSTSSLARKCSTTELRPLLRSRRE